MTTEDVGTCSSAGVCSNASYSTAATCIAAGATWTGYDTQSVCTGASATWTTTHTAPHDRHNLKFVSVDDWRKHHRESDDDEKDLTYFKSIIEVIISEST